MNGLNVVKAISQDKTSYEVEPEVKKFSLKIEIHSNVQRERFGLRRLERSRLWIFHGLRKSSRSEK